MAENKTLQTRIALKTDNSANWQAHGDFKPLEGEAVIIQDLNPEVMPNGWDIKIGHNNTAISDLKGLGEGLQEWFRKELKVADALIFKGVVHKDADLPTADQEIGWTYKVGTAGTYDGKACNVGDLIIWGHDAGTTVVEGWMVVQSNLTSATFTGTPFTIKHPAHSAIKSVTSTFKGTTANIVHEITPAGTVSVTHDLTSSHGHTFTGTEGTISVTGTSTGTVNDATITPAGTVTAEFQGAAASHNHTFTGTAASHNHTFTGTQGTATTNYTPAGTIADASITPAGTVTSTFTGENAEIAVKGKAAGTVAIAGLNGSINSHKHTFTGNAANLPVGWQVVNNIASKSITPTGNVTSTFTGKEGDLFVSGTVVGSSENTSIKPEGTVTVTFAGEANNAANKYTPKGTVSSHSHGLPAANTTTVTEVTGWNAGKPTNVTASNRSVVNGVTVAVSTFNTTNSSYSFVNNVSNVRPGLTISHNVTKNNVSYVTVTAGTAPSLTTADITVVTGIPTSTNAAQPTFTGTSATITPKFTGTAANHSHTVNIGVNSTGKFTPAGNVVSTFTGDSASHTHGFTLENKTTTISYTPVGIIENSSLKWTFQNGTATFTGTEVEFTGAYTPEGSVTSRFNGTASSHSHGFAGTEATINSTFTPAGIIENTSITPAGTVKNTSITPSGAIVNAKFVGTEMTHNHGFSGTSHTSTGKFTPVGTINTVTNLKVNGSINAAFNGAKGTITYDYTPTGTITNTYAWNNKAESTETITPAGTVTLTTTQ